MQTAINLGKTFLRISRKRNILLTWILAWYIHLLSFPRFRTLSIERFWFLFWSILNGVTLKTSNWWLYLPVNSQSITPWRQAIDFGCQNKYIFLHSTYYVYFTPTFYFSFDWLQLLLLLQTHFYTEYVFWSTPLLGAAQHYLARVVLD